MNKDYKYHVTGGYLKKNVKALALKSMAGMFNIILIFGPTRYGKSTLSFQVAKDISNLCGVPFDDTHIEFDSEKLIRLAAKGHKHHVYVLDEGAFDLKGEDWQGKANKAMRKFFNTAAKYNQTFIINIPFIGSLHRDFVRDDHARGIRVNAQINVETDDPKKKYKRGFAKLYKERLIDQWFGCKASVPHSQLWRWKADTPVTSFGSNTNFIDEVAYQKKKDAAIKKLSEKDNQKGSKVEQHMSKLIKYMNKEEGMSYSKIGNILDIHENTVGRMARISK